MINDAQRPRATMADVAQRAGVSRQTVSNVLNSPDLVKEDTKERVHQAINDLDYRPNKGARRLRTNESRTIGIRLEPYRIGISGAIFDRFLHALTVGATQADHRVVVYASDSPEDEVQRIHTLAAEQEVDAVVLTATFPGDPRGEALTEAGIRYVSFGRPWDTPVMETSDWVDVDGAHGTWLATKSVIDQTGKPAAYLGWPSVGGTGADRQSGWEKATIEAGYDPEGLLIHSEDEVGGARKAVLDALEQGVFDRSGALVCSSDQLAVGGRLALQGAGRDDVVVTGFDNTPTAQALSIASVEQHPEKVAEAVLDLLLHPETAPTRVLIEPELVPLGGQL